VLVEDSGPLECYAVFTGMYVVTDVSKQRTAFFFRVQQFYSRMLMTSPIRSFEVSVAVCQPTLHGIARDLIVQQHHSEQLKCHEVLLISVCVVLALF